MPKSALFLLTGFYRLLCFQFNPLCSVTLHCLCLRARRQRFSLEGPYEDTAAFCAFKHPSILSFHVRGNGLDDMESRGTLE